MKLETETLDILKNFSTINPSIAVKQGNVLKTVSLTNSVVAKATIKQSFEKPFAIYDLANFLSAVSMFDAVELNFEEDERYVVLTNAESSAMIRYFYADESMVFAAPEKDFPALSSNIKFRITKDTLAAVLKATSVLSVPEVVFIGDGTNVTAEAYDPAKNTSNRFRKVISESSAEFSAHFKVENMKLIPNDYDLTILPPKKQGGQGIAHLQSPSVEYWIAPELHSKF